MDNDASVRQIVRHTFLSNAFYANNNNEKLMINVPFDVFGIVAGLTLRINFSH